ncbi:MAG: phosphodiester glycosidase family protein [Bacteroidales bacterium]|nr:phosphodiester glycosidase family protein [Bacteroidales bacterium]
MKRASTFRIYLFITLVVFTHGLNGQINGFKKIHWEREKIAPGLTWKLAHTVLNDSIPQNINILIVNLHKREIFLSYNPKNNIIVSKQATEAGALAAVNAGFFNIRDGGSATYIRTGGLILDPDTAKKWTRNANMTGSVLIDKNGHIIIDRAKTNSWYDSHPEYTEVLITGPLLITGKEKIQLPSTSLVVNKHPRTAIGKRGNHKVILVTLDGRTDQAKGMTLGELTDLMISLRCKDAVNLDGGGSTTMWISGKPFNGIVNMPCDNKKFDQAGERAVSDILIIK